MFQFRCTPGFEPIYMTPLSAAADIFCREETLIKANSSARVPTGIWIESVDLNSLPASMIPEIQIRARSGLAYRHGLMLLNGVGTIDADYRDEIAVLFYNSLTTDYTFKVGDRIAQMLVNIVVRLPQLKIGEQARQGGFGSTGIA